MKYKLKKSERVKCQKSKKSNEQKDDGNAIRKLRNNCKAVKIKVAKGKIAKKIVKRKCYTQVALNSAVQAVKEGQSLRIAAKMYGVPHVTPEK